MAHNSLHKIQMQIRNTQAHAITSVGKWANSTSTTLAKYRGDFQSPQTGQIVPPTAKRIMKQNKKNHYIQQSYYKNLDIARTKCVT